MELIKLSDPEIMSRISENFDNWLLWQDHSLVLQSSRDTNMVRELFKQLGIKEPQEVQIRNAQIRFKNKDDMALCILNGLKEYCDV